MKCWASCLGDCSKGGSREHYISDSIFDGETITAMGLPWCRGTPKTIGLKSAVAKILCRKHNSELSVFDNEAANFARYIKDDLVGKPLFDSCILLRGSNLEKWAVKTFFNLGYLRALHPQQPNSISPSEKLVRYIFQNGAIDDGIGLYFISNSVSAETTRDGVSWNVIWNPDQINQIFGMAIVFCGVRFVLSIIPMRVERQISELGVVNSFDYSKAQVAYRPPNIIFSNQNATQKRINFDW